MGSIVEMAEERFAAVQMLGERSKAGASLMKLVDGARAVHVIELIPPFLEVGDGSDLRVVICGSHVDSHGQCLRPTRKRL